MLIEGVKTSRELGIATTAIMGQQHQQIHNNIGREHEESTRDDEAPANPQHSRAVIVGNYICEDIISPISLLRSDRFARSKPTESAAGQGGETARVSEQARGREEKINSFASDGLCREINSSMIEPVNTMQRRATAIRSADSGGVNSVRKRGKAPSKVRPITTAGAAAKVRSTLSTEQDGGDFLPPSHVTPSPQKMRIFSSISACETDFDAPPSENSMGHICLTPLAGSDITDIPDITDITELSSHGARLSQSPLRCVSTALSCLSEGCFRQSPIRSKPAVVRVSPDQMARQVSQLEPSSHLDDEWSSRCFKLSQQIVEHLQSWSKPSPSDGQISKSPIMNRP